MFLSGEREGTWAFVVTANMFMWLSAEGQAASSRRYSGCFKSDCVKVLEVEGIRFSSQGSDLEGSSRSAADTGSRWHVGQRRHETEDGCWARAVWLGWRWAQEANSVSVWPHLCAVNVRGGGGGSLLRHLNEAREAQGGKLGAAGFWSLLTTGCGLGRTVVGGLQTVHLASWWCARRSSFPMPSGCSLWVSAAWEDATQGHLNCFPLAFSGYQKQHKSLSSAPNLC